ncbi:hypothetical protein F4703DRAFT_1791325 [Phycomyces blakesleeanus]|uniref:Uncharacterized protein n=1 Tax=Phycomyces blakesleeanus (strain ATCC 8743b / DSM 1359 / FGSC 10004 / NBRC 33097 / NRRL 1555) TaxID=763407 RepID=A0A163D1X6_PHYB8|nr:hypothetical protein PHYBLDRAFT_173603 [Phycomyces blakesleeanus NRRL 1555(-)]OAD68110.1 hypothetical protein PHYBLDRAFT_173603 [Phycomyces blakesleeanus NRRL 1555(-)]|eukprot:XP_018286150.1 hypothetical protein PHYBLDRAFT_173603 [Phycomyces blakesleeanus NRRL 1555(-)]
MGVYIRSIIHLSGYLINHTAVPSLRQHKTKSKGRRGLHFEEHSVTRLKDCVSTEICTCKHNLQPKEIDQIEKRILVLNMNLSIYIYSIVTILGKNNGQGKKWGHCDEF